ncbi:MAG: hypothetical protein GWP08_08425 [Nitrospiraceae bacterium]|nr:hypothetical protein [Nitrospiraceae bacterium]
MRAIRGAAVLVVFLSLGAWSQGLSYRPGREFRTINTDSLEISVQKNGRTDVLLTSGHPVFANAYPMVWIDGEEEPEPLKIDGRWTARQPINNALGRGNGIFFKKGNCEWGIQVYPAQPFITAHVTFVNTAKKPVRVRALYPWVAGGLKKGEFSLGPGAPNALILDTGTLTNVQTSLHTLESGSCECLWNMAIFNPVSGRSLIAGFLTNTQAYTAIRVERTDDAGDAAFDRFSTICTFDPPVEVAPGGRLESEFLYLGIAETDPLRGLERFGASVAAISGVRPSRRALPHGWDSWATKFHTDIDEASMMAALDFVDTRLKRYGWRHFSIDDGWQRETGDWEPDPAKFPRGMKWLADEIHRRGMTAGIWTDPFTVSLDAPLAKEHPEWLAEPNAMGRTMLGDSERILDITAPGVYEYVKGLFTKLGQEWGYDAFVETDFVYHLLMAESYHQPHLTRVQVLQMGMSAIRAGAGPDRFIMAVGPLPITGTVGDGARLGIDCAPIWRKAPDAWPWGCVETLTNAAHRYYLASHLWAPDQDCAYFGRPETRKRWKVAERPQLTQAQSVAWLTGAALTGGVVKIGDNYPDLDEAQVRILSRILPVPDQPARPVDLFERAEPAIWSLPVTSPIGDWHIVGVFNWDETESAKIPVYFGQLGLRQDASYTVYDFWQDQYYGNARGSVTVSIAPGSVRLLGLRRHVDRPMFLATDRHFTQGATDFTALDWNGAERKLTASFEGVANTDYNLRVLVPEAFTPGEVAVSAGEARTSFDGKVLGIAFHCDEEGPVTWSAQF